MKSRVTFLSFHALFVSLLLLLFAPAFVGSEILPAFSRGLYILTMLCCLYMVSSNRRELMVGLILFVPTLITQWFLTPGISEANQLLGYCILQTAFLVYVMRTVYLQLMTVNSVDSEIFFAALILYQLFGACMALVYYAILIVNPDTFDGAIVLNLTDELSRSETMHELLYFSFVTQTTLGYGDISPINDIGRSAAIFQAIIGQLYIAVIIARLVGIHIAEQTSR